MEFNKKLQELRKQSGLTQEELAEKLYVSRTAISKWEAGRGYPNIDSLKAISKFFSVTIDELLSEDELLTVAQEDSKEKTERFSDLFFGLLDIGVIMIIFMPFFAQRVNGAVSDVSLLYFVDIKIYLKITYFTVIILIALFGIFTLAAQNLNKDFWGRIKRKVSLLLNVIGILLFIISLQPYAAIFLFLFLAIKVVLLLKKQ